MNVSAFHASALHASTISRLQGLSPVAGPPSAASAAGPDPAAWLLADDGVGGALLQAGPRSARLAIDALEQQFLAALTRSPGDAG